MCPSFIYLSSSVDGLQQRFEAAAALEQLVLEPSPEVRQLAFALLRKIQE